MKRREIITKIILATGGSSIVMSPVLKAFPNYIVTPQMLSKSLLDYEFLSVLVAGGIKDAAKEMGWTPWERWSLKNNRPIRSAWILYPVKQPLKRDFINWYMLEVSENLFPRILTENVREEVAEQDVRMVTITPEQVADAIWDARSQPDNNPNHYNREKKNN